MRVIRLARLAHFCLYIIVVLPIGTATGSPTIGYTDKNAPNWIHRITVYIFNETLLDRWAKMNWAAENFDQLLIRCVTR